MTACPFCGEDHEQPDLMARTFTPTTVFDAFEIAACPKIPRGHFYEDIYFENGPPGRLHRLEGE